MYNTVGCTNQFAKHNHRCHKITFQNHLQQIERICRKQHLDSSILLFFFLFGSKSIFFLLLSLFELLDCSLFALESDKTGIFPLLISFFGLLDCSLLAPDLETTGISSCLLSLLRLLKCSLLAPGSSSGEPS